MRVVAPWRGWQDQELSWATPTQISVLLLKTGMRGSGRPAFSYSRTLPIITLYRNAHPRSDLTRTRWLRVDWIDPLKYEDLTSMLPPNIAVSAIEKSDLEQKENELSLVHSVIDEVRMISLQSRYGSRHII